MKVCDKEFVEATCECLSNCNIFRIYRKGTKFGTRDYYLRVYDTNAVKKYIPYYTIHLTYDKLKEVIECIVNFSENNERFYPVEITNIFRSGKKAETVIFNFGAHGFTIDFWLTNKCGNKIYWETVITEKQLIEFQNQLKEVFSEELEINFSEFNRNL